MTLNELLALLGRAWSRLLIYPGGITAFAALWLIALLQSREPSVESYQRRARAGSWSLALGALVPPWLGLALLPLPPAATLSRQTDLIVALALLEWPLVLAIARELRSDDSAQRAAGVRRLAAALNSYPALILSGLALAQPAGSFEIAALARLPGELAPEGARALHWIGAVAWALALVPALGLGPFAAWPPGAPGASAEDSSTARATPQSRKGAGFLKLLRTSRLGEDPLRTGLQLRALGLVWLAALPWMAGLGALEEGGLQRLVPALAWLLSPAAITALLWGCGRLTAGRAARWWARVYLGLDLVLLLALLWAAYQALQRRLS
ncbi:MAG: hypothetical protein IPO81_07950 [Kouleothrix sp.]|nr:hypothetical protein [Kouleothrix sp.]